MSHGAKRRSGGADAEGAAGVVEVPAHAVEGLAELTLAAAAVRANLCQMNESLERSLARAPDVARLAAAFKAVRRPGAVKTAAAGV